MAISRMRSSLAERALDQPDVGDDALVGVVVGVEDQALERRFAGSPFGGGTRSTIASRISATPVPSLAEARITSSRGIARTFSSSSMTCSGSAVGRSILLMTGMIVRSSLERQVDVGEGLGLDALGGVDDEDRALAGLQAAADLVGEVDVAGRVDQVEPVRLAVARRGTPCARRGP